jgi:D-lactate dehydrogenase (cytochrome)
MIATLQHLFGEKVSIDPTILEVHGKDTSYPVVHSPEAVIFTESVEDVLKVLAWCREQQTVGTY